MHQKSSQYRGPCIAERSQCTCTLYIVNVGQSRTRLRLINMYQYTIYCQCGSKSNVARFYHSVAIHFTLSMWLKVECDLFNQYVPVYLTFNIVSVAQSRMCLSLIHMYPYT